MIKLKRGNLTMEVSTEVQASAFTRAGWVACTDGTENAKEPASYTRSEISRMNTESLKALGVELGIDGAENSTGARLKEEILVKLGL